jgi:hypothetical protein
MAADEQYQMPHLQLGNLRVAFVQHFQQRWNCGAPSDPVSQNL